MPVGRAVAILGTVALLAGTSCGHSSEHSLNVSVTPTSSAIGDWTLDLDPTMAEAIRALGQPSSCRILPVTKFASASWRSLGLRMVFGTYGGTSRGDDCHAPKEVFLSSAEIRGGGWRTTEGLRIGDSTSRLMKLYPYAFRHAGPYGQPGGFWLVVRTTPVPDFHAYPALLAKSAGQKVTSFVVSENAEGD